MADESASDEAPITFNVKSSNDTKYTVTISLSATVADLKEKLSTKEFADLAVDRQRLIYSGRVLKDAETLSSYKIQPGNTVHLVKGAASNVRQNPANQGTAVPAAMPTNLSSGTGNNPLAGLTGARYAGFAQLPSQDMFGPDGGMGPPPDPEDMIRMLQNPQFASTLNEALSNPTLVDTMIQQNPLLRDMGPQVRQMLQSPEFRRMMTDPEQMRSMIQMQRMFGGGMFGAGSGGAGGNNAFPAPGVTDTTPTSQQQQGQTQGQAQGQQRQAPAFNPFAAFGQAQGQTGQAPANPFAALFNPGLFGNSPLATPPAAASAGQGTPTGQDGTTQASTTSTTTTSNPSQPQQPQQQQPQFPFPNPNLMYNPQMLQQLLAAMTPPGNQQSTQQTSSTNTSTGTPQPGTGAPGNANPFAALMNPWLLNAMGAGNGLDGAQTQSAPADTRPPEERYAEQLRQLNEMGFYEFERNVEALRRSGGSVQGAVEYLLTH